MRNGSVLYKLDEVANNEQLEHFKGVLRQAPLAEGYGEGTRRVSNGVHDCSRAGRLEDVVITGRSRASVSDVDNAIPCRAL